MKGMHVLFPGNEDLGIFKAVITEQVLEAMLCIEAQSKSWHKNPF
jgi:hypothetical protein